MSSREKSRGGPREERDLLIIRGESEKNCFENQRRNKTSENKSRNVKFSDIDECEVSRPSFVHFPGRKYD